MPKHELKIFFYKLCWQIFKNESKTPQGSIGQLEIMIARTCYERSHKGIDNDVKSSLSMALCNNLFIWLVKIS